MTPRMSLHNAKIVLKDKVVNATLTLQKGLIASVSDAPVHADHALDCGGDYLLPGFFETHMHGMKFVDVVKGVPVPDSADGTAYTYDQPFQRILLALPQTGVTSAILSSYACLREELDRFLVEGGKAVENPVAGGARLVGLDMEGNFLKDPAFAGAQDPDKLLAPSPDAFDRLQDKAGGHLRKALIAPEWGEDAFAMIRRMAEKGGVPSVGHTGCTRDALLKAWDCGTRVVVHCGNGPMSQNFKAGGALDGIFELGPKIYGEVICDLRHIHPRWINTFQNCFGPDHFLAVSDATRLAGAGLPDGTELERCVIRDGALWVKGKANTLAGSIATLDLQFNNMLNLLTADRKAYFELRSPPPETLESALPRLARFYSLNPAECFGTDREIGSIEPGKRADLVLAGITGAPGQYRFEIKKVWIGGKVVG